MGDNTGIEWTHITLPDGRVYRGASWNPIAAFDRTTNKRGWFCVRVGQGCKHCYAATLNKRLGTGHDYAANYLDQVRFDLVNLDQPLRWTQPRGIFVNSMTDLFGEFVTDAMIDAVFAVMALSPDHIFQVLTKRPARMLAYFQRSDLYDRVLVEANKLRSKRPALAAIPISDLARFPLPNVWLGVSAEDQATADERIPLLLQTPAAVRWISAEPLLGPVDLGHYLVDDWTRVGDDVHYHVGDGLHWVVVGGESGPGARPMHPDWARSLRDQCVAAGVPYFFKQWGQYCPGELQSEGTFQGYWMFQQGSTFHAQSHGDPEQHMFQGEPRGDWRSRPVLRDPQDPSVAYLKLGKLWSGRRLDAREWNEYPAVRTPA